MLRCRKFILSTAMALSALASACAAPTSGISDDSSVAPVAYCSSAKVFTVPTVTISGRAAYEWRILGNMYLADGSFRFTDDPAGTGNFEVVINGQTYSGTTLANLRTAINSDISVNATAELTLNYADFLRSGSQSNIIRVLPKNFDAALNVAAGNRLLTTDKDNVPMSGPLNPIRFAEVRVTDSAGQLVQCSETDSTGGYSFAIPRDTGTYKVEITSRAFSAKNTAYVMRNPSGNAYYSLSASVNSTMTATVPMMIAKASGSYEAGAFNILDQIYKSQEYLRTKTANCGSGPYQDCVPFNAFAEQHIVYTYWTPGLSPGVYVGSSGPISFYFNGQRQLYIGGGQNGNVTNSDMDHFDNSVIIHEYGHFIEDHFGNPDSPGGSHDGDSIIDPRLAWGEGWANFFQAAVLYPNTGMDPVYRDTKGNVECGSPTCTGAIFNVDLDLQNGRSVGWQNLDIPQEDGEGIFHEFSITRVLYQVIMQYDFAEIWANLNGPTHGMKASTDHFKSMARFNRLQTTATGLQNDWSTTIRDPEKQYNGALEEYGTPLTVGGTCTASYNVNFNVYYNTSDPGGFAYSDLFHNNDFYAYRHTGGSLNVELTWASSPKSDLDLYIYPKGYYFGEGWSAASAHDAQGLTGTETISTSLPAGLYMINVMAYTGKNRNNVYVYDPPSGPRPATYKLKINGTPACPNPTGEF